MMFTKRHSPESKVAREILNSYSNLTKSARLLLEGDLLVGLGPEGAEGI